MPCTDPGQTFSENWYNRVGLLRTMGSQNVTTDALCPETPLAESTDKMARQLVETTTENSVLQDVATIYVSRKQQVLNNARRTLCKARCLQSAQEVGQ